MRPKNSFWTVQQAKWKVFSCCSEDSGATAEIQLAFKRSGCVKHRVDWRQESKNRCVEKLGQLRDGVAMRAKRRILGAGEMTQS